MKNRSVIRIILIVGGILLVPLVLTILNPSSHMRGGGGGGWDWAPGDFLAMGVLIFMAGLAIDSASRKIPNHTHRILVVVAILIMLVVIWIELAVDAVSRFLSMLF